MSDFCTVQDVIDIFRPLTQDEQDKTEKMIPLICDTLRGYAKRVGKDIDEMILENPSYANVCKMVTIDIVSRCLRQNLDAEPMTQFSQSALGYTISGSPAMAGGGVGSAILNNDLKRLGLKVQRYGALEIYGNQGC